MFNWSNQEKEKYKSIFELSPEAIVIIDPKGNIVDINGRVYDWLGFKTEELIGKKLNEAPFLNEESQIRAQENFIKRMVGAEILPYELDFVTKKGEKVVGRVIGSPIRDKNKKITSVIIMISDITQHKAMEMQIKKSEEKYRNIITSSPDAIVIGDLNGKIIDCNQAALDLLNFNDKKEVIGRNAFEFVIPKERKSAMTVLEKTLKYGQVKNIELTLTTNDGKEFLAEISASVVKDSSGKPEFLVALVKDISERKRVERAKSEFTSIASHQLRTPLSIMNWYTEMVLDGKAGKLSPKQKKYLKEIYVANSKLIKLVNLLLNISRIDLGTFVINVSKTDLVKSMNDVVKDLLPQIREKKIKIEKNYPEKSLWIDTDSNIMNIVFQNLLSNSVRYTDNGGKITITLEKKTSSILIQVSDTGYGIPKNQQSQIFSRFFRAENVKQKDTTGTGLGLYIVKSVIDQIDGEIWFKSNEKEGTTFYVKIPLELKKI